MLPLTTPFESTPFVKQVKSIKQNGANYWEKKINWVYEIIAGDERLINQFDSDLFQ